MNNVIYKAQAVSRAMALLEAVCYSSGEPSVSELASQTHIHRNTVYRLVRVMENDGFLLVTGRGGVVPGAALHAMTRRVGGGSHRQQLLLRLLEPLLKSLVEKIEEVANVGVLNHDQVFYIDKYQPRDNDGPGLFVRLGQTAPLYASAMGKLFLAGWDDHTLAQYRKTRLLEKYTPNTITTWTRLIAELEAVKASAVAVDHEELVQGICCIAVPIVLEGTTVAAISVSMPSTRYSLLRQQQLIPQLVAIAKQVSRGL